MEALLEGHARRWGFFGGVPRECVYDDLRLVGARREHDLIMWNPRFAALRRPYAFYATACTPATRREKGAVDGGVRHIKMGLANDQLEVVRVVELAIGGQRARGYAAQVTGCAPWR